MINIKRVIGDKEARNSFKLAIRWIKKDSSLNAGKVKKYFMVTSAKLSDKPEIYPPDKFSKSQDLRFRAFEKYNYSVAYFIDDETSKVLRFRQVKKEPLAY